LLCSIIDTNTDSSISADEEGKIAFCISVMAMVVLTGSICVVAEHIEALVWITFSP